MKTKLEEIQEKFDVVQDELNGLLTETLGELRVCAVSGNPFEAFYDEAVKSYFTIFNSYLKRRGCLPITEEEIKFLYGETQKKLVRK